MAKTIYCINFFLPKIRTQLFDCIPVPSRFSNNILTFYYKMSEKMAIFAERIPIFMFSMMRKILRLNLLRSVALLFAVTVMTSMALSCSCSCSCSGDEENISDSLSLETDNPYRILDLDTIPGWHALDTVTAESWLLVEATTGIPIAGKNYNNRMFPASLTKIMTCILALERGQNKMNDTIRISEDVFISKNSRTRLNDTYLMKNLILEMMMLSDNDAAYAIAKHVAGDTLKFCKMMNKKARTLNMRRTHFANPNGVPNPKNYSTAADLVRLVGYCMQNPQFAKIVGTLEEDIKLADGRHMPSKNTNRLLEEYPGCIGVKTGFINASGGCLAVAAQRDGITLYLVLLKSKYGKRFSEAPLILDFGFNVVKAAKNALSNR